MRTASNALMLKAEHFKSSIMLWCLALLIVCLLVWSAYAEVDELVRGEGKVIPSSQLKVVQSLDGGVLSELFIAEGDRIKHGQILMQLDDRRVKSKFNERKQRVLSLEAKIQRLRAEVLGAKYLTIDEALELSAPGLVAEQKALFAQRRLSLSSELDVLGQRLRQEKQERVKKEAELGQLRKELALVSKEVKILQPLYEEGVVSQVELLKAEKLELAANRQLLDIELEIPQVESQIKELENKQEQIRQSYKTEAQIELSEAASELAEISQANSSLEADVERAQLKSPVNGTVKQLMLTTIGGVVKPGMDLVSIVPDEDTLIIETKVRPSDIARLYPGQKAMVKFTAYDFTVYGGLEAQLVHISADSLTDEQGNSFYLVRVQTDKSFLGRELGVLPIIPGMQAQVDILTGKKTLLSYLLKPILKAKQVALTEQ